MLAPRTLAALRRLHRWAGLAIAGFVILVGLTGSVLTFYWELDELIYPMRAVAPTADASPLNIGELATHALAVDSHIYLTEIYLPQSDIALARVAPRIDTETGKPYLIAFDEITLNPYTGAEINKRLWGAISAGWQNLLPFIYELHYGLALGDWGIWLLGIVALIWTLDCFVGLIITFPARSSQRPARRTFLSQWKKAWLIRWPAKRWRFNFDLHRAGSLWLWLMLLIFAWSSVYMNLWDSVYTRVTASVMEYHPPWSELANRQRCADEPARDWSEVNSTAVKLMEDEARNSGFEITRPISLRYYPAYCAYRYRVLSSLDICDRSGNTDIYFDAVDNHLLLNYFPSRQYAGNTVSSWLMALHMAHVFGMPYRIFICVFGIFVAMISITGVLIWWKRRRPRSTLTRSTMKSSDPKSSDPTSGDLKHAALNE